MAGDTGDAETIATYQGVPCQSAGFACPYGIAPGRGFAVLPQVEWSRAFAGDPWAAAAGQPGAVTDALRAPLAHAGPLVFRRGDREVVLPRIYVAEAGAEDQKRSDELRDLGLVRVALTDVRHLWSRGDLWGEFNIQKSSLHGLSPLKVIKTTIRGDDIGEIEGEPHTLLDLVRLCLRRLPGDLQLADNEGARAAAEVTPANLRYYGELASTAMTHLLAAWKFRLTYDPIADACALWREGDGPPQFSEQGARTLSLRFSTGGKRGDVSVPPQSIRFRRRSPQPVYKPKSVRVVGKRAIREARIALRPVGEINGELVPLDTALQWHGLSRDEARKWVMVSRDAQIAWRGGSLGSANVAAIRRWAYRWFAPPDEATGLLPILERRARSMVDGSERVPAVWADSYSELRFDEWLRWYEKQLAGLENDVLALIEARRSDYDRFVDLNWLRKRNPALADYLEAIRAGLHARTRYSEAFKDHTKDSIRLDLEKQVAALQVKVGIDQRKIARNERREIRFSNHPLALMSPESYQVDRRGVVRFNRVIGQLELPENLSDVYVRDQARIQPGDPQVRMVCAYHSSPTARKAAAALGLSTNEEFAEQGVEADHYSLLGDVQGEKVRILNPGGVEPEGAEKLYPRVVRHDLQLWYDVDGETNRGELDVVASSIVKRELSGPDALHGETGESADLVPIACSGVVSEVEWRLGSDGRVATAWRAGNVRDVDGQQTQIRIRGTEGLGTGPGSVINPDVRGPR